MAPLTVVFVCSGNTCRSPLTAALARSLWPAGVVFLSAGLHATEGQPASDAARAAAGERDLELADHRARTVEDALLAQADWLIGMTRSHAAQLKTRLCTDFSDEGSRPRIGLLGCANQDLSGCPVPMAEEVADPFGEPLDAYRTTIEQCTRLLRPWEATFSGQAKGDA